MATDQVQEYPYEAYNDGQGYEFTCICGEVRLITDDLNNETETVEQCTTCANPGEAFKIVFRELSMTKAPRHLQGRRYLVGQFR